MRKCQRSGAFTRDSSLPETWTPWERKRDLQFETTDQTRKPSASPVFFAFLMRFMRRSYSPYCRHHWVIAWLCSAIALPRIYRWNYRSDAHQRKIWIEGILQITFVDVLFLTLFSSDSPSTNFAAYTAGEKMPNFACFPPMCSSVLRIWEVMRGLGAKAPVSAQIVARTRIAKIFIPCFWIRRMWPDRQGEFAVFRKVTLCVRTLGLFVGIFAQYCSSYEHLPISKRSLVCDEWMVVAEKHNM